MRPTMVRGGRAWEVSRRVGSSVGGSGTLREDEELDAEFEAGSMRRPVTREAVLFALDPLDGADGRFEISLVRLRRPVLCCRS